MFSPLSSGSIVFLTAAIFAAAIPNNPPPYTTATQTVTSTATVTSIVTGTQSTPVATVIVTPPPATTTVSGSPSNQCNTGTIQCCNSVEPASSSVVSGLLTILGVVLTDLTGLVGFNCSPLSVTGIGGNSCTQQPVCCENNNVSGLISIGCTPININL